MPLAAQATIPIPLVPGLMGYTCHVATWFWAAQEAQALGLTAVKAVAVTVGNIAAMVPNAQAAMLALPSSGSWDFATTPTTPPVGTVLVWTGGATHSAIVTALNTITGYNQAGWFPALNALGIAGAGHSSPPLMSLAGHLRRVNTVAEDTIVQRAGLLNL